MAIGTTTALILGAAGTFGASKLMGGGGKNNVSAPSVLPQPPSVEKSEALGEEAARRKKSAMTKSVYSSPLGVSGEAGIARKTLLGQ